MTAPVANDIAQAVSHLKGGGVVVLPTDTLYALAALATDAGAVRRVYQIKGREDGKPLPLFVSSPEMAAQAGRMTPSATILARRFWPGALTLVVQRQPDFVSEALAGGETVALRMPQNDIIIEVVQAVAGPITATSANRSGGANPVTAKEVVSQLNDEMDIVVDTGPCPVGVASTIVDCTGDEPVILRHGAIDDATIFQALREA